MFPHVFAFSSECLPCRHHVALVLIFNKYVRLRRLMLQISGRHKWLLFWMLVILAGVWG